MPDGYEFAETLNGVVSVRRVGGRPSRVPDAGVDMVRRELARHGHLRPYAVDVRNDEIIVCEPDGLPAETDPGEWARTFGMAEKEARRRWEARAPRARYAPVMKFAFIDAPGTYLAHRRRYWGKGGWWTLSCGPLPELLWKYAPHLDTERFFESL
jgi:hypothetical protein